MQACVHMSNLFDAGMDDFGHTALRRGAFDPLPRQKCSKLQAVPCAFFLTTGQNRSRPDNVFTGFRPS